MSRAHHELRSLRLEIDAIDLALLELVSERARVASRIARVKDELGLPTRDPAREAALLSDRVSRNPGPLPDSAVARFFGEILAISRALMDHARASGARPAEEAER